MSMDRQSWGVGSILKWKRTSAFFSVTWCRRREVKRRWLRASSVSQFSEAPKKV